MKTSKKLILERFAYTPFGSFGRLSVEGFECFTVEQPWNDNETCNSCIAEGWYSLRLGRYNKGNYDTYEVENCYNRSLIKFHIGNTMSDVMGCIALGSDLGFVNSEWAVVNSKNTFNEFMKVMDNCIDASLRIVQYRA